MFKLRQEEKKRQDYDKQSNDQNKKLTLIEQSLYQKLKVYNF